ncbi:TPA: hypothetical protein ACH3X3_005288 [Trebouxia sp. C0006]
MSASTMADHGDMQTLLMQCAHAFTLVCHLWKWKARGQSQSPFIGPMQGCPLCDAWLALGGKQDGIFIEQLTPACTGHDFSCWGYFRQFTLTELTYADDICIKKTSAVDLQALVHALAVHCAILHMTGQWQRQQ